jgi:hypothetical protein
MSHCRRGRPTPSEHHGALGSFSTSPYPLRPSPDLTSTNLPALDHPTPSEHHGALGSFSTSPYPLPPAADHNIHKFASAGPPRIQLWASSGKNTTRKFHINTHCKQVDSIWHSNVARRSLCSFSPSPHPLTPQGTIPTSTNLPEMGNSVASSGKTPL